MLTKWIRRALFIAALGVTPLVALGVWCQVTVGMGLHGFVLYAACVLAWIAALRRRGTRLFAASGIILVVGMLGFTVFPDDTVQMVRLDSTGKKLGLQTAVSNLAGRMIPEREPILVALDLRMRADPFPGESDQIVDAMAAAYDRMPMAMSVGPSPAVATYLGQQTADSFDLLVVDSAKPARGTAIFLHGYGGNFSVQCYLFAELVRQQGYRTLCPSLSLTHHWNDPAGRRVIDATSTFAGQAEHVVFGGLSDGGVALSKLWPKADAYVVISGTSSGARCPPKPALVVHGRDDRIASPSTATRLAGRCHHVSAELEPGGHFVLALRPNEVRKQVEALLQTRPAAKPTNDR